MHHLRFDQPVTILVGMGFPVTIENVMQAYTMLQDWPAIVRNGAHRAAINACKAGLAGEIDPETVRATLVAFARRNEIMVENLLSRVGSSNDSQRIMPQQIHPKKVPKNSRLPT